MKKEAIQHFNTEEYIYPVKRNELVFKIRCAKKGYIEMYFGLLGQNKTGEPKETGTEMLLQRWVV